MFSNQKAKSNVSENLGISKFTMFIKLYEIIISDLRTELQAALVDLGHKNAFDLLLKEAWNPEQAAMGNFTLPTVSDKLNIMASIHNRKLIAALSRELKEKDAEI